MKTHLRNVCSFAVICGALMVGCGGGSSSQDTNPIVTGPVSFSQNVQPIFNQTCARAGARPRRPTWSA